jgi:uncharacterized membrane protein YdjX (TVP38/TMEM64 family)
MIKNRFIRWKYIPFFLFVLFLGLFLFFEYSGILSLSDTEKIIYNHKEYAGIIIILILISDIITPIPSSIVMTISGNIYGFFWGAIISYIGAVLSALLGFLLFRNYGRKKTLHILGKKEYASMNKYFRVYGETIIIISRMFPMVTEVISCFAGLTKISIKRFFILVSLGTLPMVFYYAYFGSVAENASEWAMPLILGFLIPGVIWFFLSYKK